MKVNVLIPSFNERESLLKLLDILKDLQQIESICIVDGSSNDGTRELVFNYPDSRISFISSDEYSLKKSISPIAKSRNVALTQFAEGCAVFFIDLGCEYQIDTFRDAIDWINTKNIDYVFTKTEAAITTSYSRRYAKMMISPQNNYSNNHLPSSRFLLLRYDCLQAIGGYKENAFAGEDTDFSIKMIKGFKGQQVPGYIFWKVPSSRIEAIHKHYRYGQGDGAYGNRIGVILFCFFLPFIPTKKQDLSILFLEKILLRFAYGIGGLSSLINRK